MILPKYFCSNLIFLKYNRPSPFLMWFWFKLGLSALRCLMAHYSLQTVVLLTVKRTESARSFPKPDAETASAAPGCTHLHDTVISTLVAGMLPLMGSKSQTVAVASTLSITSPSMLAGDSGQLPGTRVSL